MQRYRLSFLLGAMALVLALLPVVSQAQAGLRIEQWTTASGARVLFVRSATIPMLDVNVDFDAGARYDPAGKAGVASMTVGLLAKGLSQPDGAVVDEAAVSEAFASIGALRGGGATDDRTSVSLRTLSSNAELDAAIDWTARVLAFPGFPAAVLQREKERVIASLTEAQGKPDTIARRTFNELAYGSHPYGVDASTGSIAVITREDLSNFHRQYFRADRAVVSMIGAITRQQAEVIAQKLTERLPRDAVAAPVMAFDPVKRPAVGIERRIEHAASQSHILIGAPAIARGDPDFFSLLVGNYVLGGGGFVSRLYSEVREKRGLAYSVYSYFTPSRDPGPFTIGLQTRREQTNEALQVVRTTLERFLRDGPTQAELDAAKSNMIGGFPLRIDSNRKILDNLAVIGYYGLPVDYLDTWMSKVESVTLESVRAAFTRHVAADRLVTVVVGAGS